MNCIFDFLKDETQKEYRRIAQLQEDRFEKILENYKEIFISELELSLQEELCETHKAIFRSKDIKNTIKNIEIEQIKHFFDVIINDVYNNWISGKAYDAIGNLVKLLNTEELLSKSTFSIKKLNLFRGRKSYKAIYNKYDMFHIPYDKRYLVNNQRFSLSGYPLLYLNCSIEGVCAELDIKEDEIESYVFSLFNFKKDYSIYSLENPFKKYLVIFKKETEGYISPYLKLNKTFLKNQLFKLILSSICCFEKRFQHSQKEKNGEKVFYEEYVIPQALTQVLKMNNIDGIYYPSTRVKEIDNTKTFNLVFFPEYRDRHYDNKLYENLFISTPIIYNNVKEIDINKTKIKELLNLVFKLIQEKKEIKNEYLNDLLDNLFELENLLKINNNNLEIELVLRYNFILNRLLELKRS